MTGKTPHSKTYKSVDLRVGNIFFNLIELHYNFHTRLRELAPAVRVSQEVIAMMIGHTQEGILRAEKVTKRISQTSPS